MIAPSKKVQTFRGRKAVEADSVDRVWNLVEDRTEFRYEINREHREIQRLTERLSPEAFKVFSDLLLLIEASFPVVDAHNRLAQDQVPAQDRVPLDLLVEAAIGGWPAFRDGGMSVADFIELLLLTEPYASAEGFRDRDAESHRIRDASRRKVLK